MGVRTLVGTYDGTTPAAVMVDSVTGFAVGQIFEGHNAPEQIEAFLDWLAGRPYLTLADEIGLAPRDVTMHDGGDPRAWPDSGLEKLVAYWKREVWNPAVEEVLAGIRERLPEGGVST